MEAVEKGNHLVEVIISSSYEKLQHCLNSYCFVFNFYRFYLLFNACINIATSLQLQI